MPIPGFGTLPQRLPVPQQRIPGRFPGSNLQYATAAPRQLVEPPRQNPPANPVVNQFPGSNLQFSTMGRPQGIPNRGIDMVRNPSVNRAVPPQRIPGRAVPPINRPIPQPRIRSRSDQNTIRSLVGQGGSPISYNGRSRTDIMKFLSQFLGQGQGQGQGRGQSTRDYGFPRTSPFSQRG